MSQIYWPRAQNISVMDWWDYWSIPVISWLLWKRSKRFVVFQTHFPAHKSRNKNTSCLSANLLCLHFQLLSDTSVTLRHRWKKYSDIVLQVKVVIPQDRTTVTSGIFQNNMHMNMHMQMLWSKKYNIWIQKKYQEAQKWNTQIKYKHIIILSYLVCTIINIYSVIYLLWLHMLFLTTLIGHLTDVYCENINCLALKHQDGWQIWGLCHKFE